MDDGKAPLAPRHSETEQRTITAKTFYDLEMECRRQGWGSGTLVYDEEHDLFRFKDGLFAFSREHSNWKLLKERGYMEGLEASW